MNHVLKPRKRQELKLEARDVAYERMEQQSVDEEHKLERQLASYSYGYHPRPAAAVTMKRSPVRQQLDVRHQLNSNALSTANEQQVRLSSRACFPRRMLACCAHQGQGRGALRLLKEACGMLLKDACGMLQVIAKELQEEEAKLAQVQERIEMRHVTRDDRTSTAAPGLRAAQRYAPRGRHRGLKEEQLKDEQQAALKLQLASHRLRTLSRSAVHCGKH
jgi:hypothetical protein